MNIQHLTEWLSTLSGASIAAAVFGSIIVIRLLCAPYWMHRDLEAKVSAQTRGGDAKRGLLMLYTELYALRERGRFKQGAPEAEEALANWQRDLNAWGDAAQTWVRVTLGDAAVSRMMDFSSMPMAFIQGRLNDQHNNDFLRVERVLANLKALIESEAWDRPGQ